MTKKCEYCGIEYTPTKEKRKYCSDRCRQRAFRERQQEERKKQLRAYQVERRSEIPSPRYPAMNEDDPRVRLARMKAHGVCSIEYWELYAEVDRMYCGGRGVVNGISTDHPQFSEAVLLSIEENGRINAWIEKD